MIIIVEENIKLELTNRKFAGELFNVIDNNREHLSAFLSWVNNMKTEDDLTQYLSYCESLYKDKKEVSFIIVKDDNAIGRIGLHHLDLQNKIGSIGYWLSKNEEGKGIISKSCFKLLEYGFCEIKLNRIEIKASVKNYKSQAIPIKLNFKKEGILRQAELVNNEFIDLYLFSLLKEEWQTRSKNS